MTGSFSVGCVSYERLMVVRGLAAMTVSLGVLAPGGLAHAQPPVDLSAPQSRPALSRNKPVSPNATINLVNLLVKQGVLTEQQAAELIKQAENEAFVAREAVKGAADKATVAEKTAADASRMVSPPGTKRVTYVPEIVKRQLREEIKQEVMGKAKKEGWANPEIVPEWVNRIRFYGDVRVRYEHDRFSARQRHHRLAAQYNAINTGNPADFNPAGHPLPPIRNTDEDRNPLPAESTALSGDGSDRGMERRTAHGGRRQQQPGLDQYDAWRRRRQLQQISDLARPGLYPLPDRERAFHRPASAGSTIRFSRQTDRSAWQDELGFDGVAAQVKYEVTPGFVPFAVAGAFPAVQHAVQLPEQRPIGPGLRSSGLRSAQHRQVSVRRPDRLRLDNHPRCQAESRRRLLRLPQCGGQAVGPLRDEHVS